MQEGRNSLIALAAGESLTERAREAVHHGFPELVAIVARAIARLNLGMAVAAAA